MVFRMVVKLVLEMLLDGILLLQYDNALLRLSRALTLRPAIEVFVLVEPSIRILDVDLGRTVPLVAVLSLLMCREIVCAYSNCRKPKILLDD